MRAIVVLYEGKELPIRVRAEVIGAFVNYIDNNTNPAMIQFDDKEVAQMVTNGALKGEAKIINVENKEETPENMAAIYLAKTFKKYLTPTSSTYELQAALMTIAAKPPMKEELSNALFIISQTDAIQKVDNTICVRHHISRAQLEILAKTYRFICMTSNNG